MIKIKLIITLLLFATVSLYAQEKRTVNLTGSVNGVQEGYIYLQKFNNKIFDLVDSARIENGKFEFKSSIILPELYGLTLNKERSPFYIFLESNPINVQLDTAAYYKNTIVEGSLAQKRYEDFKTRPSDLKIEDFIEEDPSSIVTAYVLYRNFSYRLSPEEIRENVKALDSSLESTQYVHVLKNLANTIETVLPGNIAPDFVSTSPEGITKRFSDQIGKNYILLDFWAAWCGPCRRDNPNVVAAYKKYKDRGFTVYGVSLDKSKESWVKAIQDDELDWQQVSDLKFWNSDAAALYGVRSIPSNFLIAPNGEIIARNIRGEDLQEKLEELLSLKSDK